MKEVLKMNEIFDCGDARELLMSRIIPEINEEIKRACDERRNYMVYTFNEGCSPAASMATDPVPPPMS